MPQNELPAKIITHALFEHRSHLFKSHSAQRAILADQAKSSSDVLAKLQSLQDDSEAHCDQLINTILTAFDQPDVPQAPPVTDDTPRNPIVSS